jgi:hypothetical protein
MTISGITPEYELRLCFGVPDQERVLGRAVAAGRATIPAGVDGQDKDCGDIVVCLEPFGSLGGGDSAMVTEPLARYPFGALTI